jgi:hypothetical protein
MEDAAISSIKDLVRPAITGPTTIVNQGGAAPLINSTVPAAAVATEHIYKESAKSVVTDEAKPTDRGLIFLIASGLAAMVCLIGWLKLRGRR